MFDNCINREWNGVNLPPGVSLLPEPWDKALKTRELPNPELNPLHNPTLGKNLGRWAQVYFTTPPEKREEAVGQLLRQLERGESPVEVGAQTQPTREVRSMEDELFCPACDAANQASQKFCGSCGERLVPGALAAFTAPDNEHRVLGFGTAEQKERPAAALPAAIATPKITEPADTEWIRERTLTRFDAAETNSSGWGKYAAFAIVLLLVGFGALEWFSRQPVQVQVVTPQGTPVPANSTPPTVTPSTVAPSTAAATPVPTPAPQPSDSQPSTTAHEPARGDDGIIASSENTAAPEPSQAADRQPLRTSAVQRQADDSADAMNGTQELLLAQHFLGSGGGSRDTTEAAKWLWKAVGKQNRTATVLLADLYWHGDGVSKSCDQARLLLVAAAKKGDSAAGDKLRSLESGGCK